MCSSFFGIVSQATELKRIAVRSASVSQLLFSAFLFYYFFYSALIDSVQATSWSVISVTGFTSPSTSLQIASKEWPSALTMILVADFDRELPLGENNVTVDLRSSDSPCEYLGTAMGNPNYHVNISLCISDHMVGTLEVPDDTAVATNGSKITTSSLFNINIQSLEARDISSQFHGARLQRRGRKSGRGPKGSKSDDADDEGDGPFNRWAKILLVVDKDLIDLTKSSGKNITREIVKLAKRISEFLTIKSTSRGLKVGPHVVNLTVTKVILLKEAFAPATKRDPAGTLSAVCKKYPGGTSNTDITVLLRQNLVPNANNTIGMGFVGAACSDGACAYVSTQGLINREKKRFSLRPVRTIVHEIIHTFGANNDGPEPGKCGTNYIMGFVDTNKLSNCTTTSLTEFGGRKDLSCMKKKPSMKSIKFLDS